MTRKQRRLTLIGTGLAMIPAVPGLVSFAMRDASCPSTRQAKSRPEVF